MTCFDPYNISRADVCLLWVKILIFHSLPLDINTVLADDNSIDLGRTDRMIYSRILRWPLRDMWFKWDKFHVSHWDFGIVTPYFVPQCIWIYIGSYNPEKEIANKSWAIWILYGLYESNWSLPALNGLHLLNYLNPLYSDSMFCFVSFCFS